MERRSLYRTLLWTVALLAAVLLIFGNRGFALQAISQILAVGIAAMGFNLLLGIAGQISIGHAAFMAIGAYTTAIFSLRFGVPFPLTLVPIVVIAAVLGLVIGLPALRLKGYYLAIATLAFGVVVEQLIAGSRALGGYDGIRNIPPFFGGDRGTIITTTVVYVVMAILTSAILASPLGRRLRMVRDSVQAARSYGVDVARAKLTAFVLSAVYGGIGGAMYAHTVGFIVPTSFSLVLSLNLLAAVIIGGIATIHGGLIGSALIVGLPFIFSRSVGAFLNIVVGALLIVFVLFFPRGILYGLTIAYHRYLQRPFIAVRNMRTRRRSRDGHSITVDGVTMFFREVDNTATGGAVGSAAGNGTGDTTQTGRAATDGTMPGDTPPDDPATPRAVLYLHGNTGSSLWFDRVMDLPGRRCIAVDMPNFGRSDGIGAAEIDRYAEYVAAFIRTKEPAGVDLVAHSLGGAVAHAVVSRHPECVASLVLVDPAPPDGLVTPEEHFGAIQYYRTSRALLRRGIEAVTPGLSEAHRRDRRFRDRLTDDALLMHPDAFVGNARALSRIDYTDSVGAFEGEVLVVLGRHDTIVTEAMARRTVEAYRHARLRIEEEAGHSLMVEDPERFRSVVQGFLTARTLAQTV